MRTRSAVRLAVPFQMLVTLPDGRSKPSSVIALAVGPGLLTDRRRHAPVAHCESTWILPTSPPADVGEVLAFTVGVGVGVAVGMLVRLSLIHI